MYTLFKKLLYYLYYKNIYYDFFYNFLNKLYNSKK